MERKKIVRLVLAGTLFISSCVYSKNSAPILATTPIPTPDHTPLSTQPFLTPTPIPEVNVISGTTITNRMTGAIYEFVPDPENSGSRCVKLGIYTSFNKQTVFGAAVALGPDPSKYNDYPGFTVFDNRGGNIGSFTTTSLPDARFNIVRPGTVVCEN